MSADTKLVELLDRYKNVNLSDKSQWANTSFAFTRQLYNMLELARVIVQGARLRDESRGAHYKPDFSDRNDETVPQNHQSRLQRRRTQHLVRGRRHQSHRATPPRVLLDLARCAMFWHTVVDRSSRFGVGFTPPLNCTLDQAGRRHSSTLSLPSSAVSNDCSAWRTPLSRHVGIASDNGLLRARLQAYHKVTKKNGALAPGTSKWTMFGFDKLGATSSS